MKKVSTKIMVLFMAVALSASALVGCTAKSANGEEPVHEMGDTTENMFGDDMSAPVDEGNMGAEEIMPADGTTADITEPAPTN